MKFKIFFLIAFLPLLGFSQAVTDTAFVADNMVLADSILKENKFSTSNELYPKTLKTNIKEKYKDADFDYTLVRPKESLMDKVWRRLGKIFESIFGKVDRTKSGDIADLVFRLIAIVLIAVVLYFIIKILVQKNGNLLFGKRNKKVDIGADALFENINEINFPAKISEFELQGNHRYAVRYQFLYVLKKLSDKKLIEWNPEKTNKDYLKEIERPEIKRNYKTLVHIFDNVWYGEFSVDSESYRGFKHQFESFRF